VRRPSDQPLGPKSADDYDSDRTTATTKCSKKFLKLQQQQQQQIQQKSSLAATGCEARASQQNNHMARCKLAAATTFWPE